ncbi:hypothetical protein OH76DRAFT_1479056 [Lentinus brumalis]|uniref:Uncharacterized protein n=1 Tax=Lentinus brumalis TaxID=2498619 RepID=A0A371DQP4_9APHY|nr:hypothetical protein OH76DRAFT_1479056 [Polyporus brumalis]
MAHYSGLSSSSAREGTIAELSTYFPAQRVQEALAFIDLARKEFAKNPAAYNEFFHALELYEENQLDLKDTIIRLMLLCSGSPTLLRALNAFLPTGWGLNVHIDDVAVELITPEGRAVHPLPRAVPQFY